MKKLNYERFLSTVDKLKGNVLIVEGLKDEKALKSLGLKNIVRISGKPLIRVVQEVESKKTKDVIVLTDFDSKGRKLAARLTCLLQKYRIHPNSRLRSEFMKLGWNRIEDMNGLRFEQPAQVPLKGVGTISGWDAGFHIGGDDHVEIGSNFDKVHDKGSHKSERRGGKARHNRSDIRAD